MLALGFSSGLPFMLIFSSLSAWLRQSGINRTTIGMLAWVGLSYSLKFLWAPMVDRLSLPLLGRTLGQRRSWILLAQVAIAIVLLAMSVSDPKTQIGHVAVLALLLAFCAATQDIAIDAWRMSPRRRTNRAPWRRHTSSAIGWPSWSDLPVRFGSLRIWAGNAATPP